jgi:hypothetical protein
MLGNRRQVQPVLSSAEMLIESPMQPEDAENKMAPVLGPAP